jgi:hypothetical protein
MDTNLLPKQGKHRCMPIQFFAKCLHYNFMHVHVLFTYVFEFDGTIAALVYPSLLSRLSLYVLCLVLRQQ